MTHQTAAAFCRALETRLVAESAKAGIPLVRLRKFVVFDRFLARLTQAYPHDWLLKGGLALQLRMGGYARAMQDVGVQLALPRTSGESTRVKDLVDMLLIAAHMPVNAAALRAALRATFAAQSSGELPLRLPAPPAAWAPKYQRLDQDIGLDDGTLLAAFERARQFLDPLLSGQAHGVWSPEIGAWL